MARNVDLSQFNACLGLAFLSALNVFTALILVGASRMTMLKLAFLVLFGASFIFHHVYFVRSGRYLDLPDEFSADRFLPTRVGLGLVWLYAVVSFAMFLGVLRVAALPCAA